MNSYFGIISQAIGRRKLLFLTIGFGFPVLYYAGLLLFTMARFGEVPNYVEFHDIFHIYALVLEGTPSLSDAIPIMLEEAWFETGYKNPLYYGVATWSYMLIPPRMLLVLVMGLLLGLFTVIALYKRDQGCALGADKPLFAAAGLSTSFIALTSATLTWVVCCATPSWVVALAMLGMGVSLALFLEPLGLVLTLAGFIVLPVAIHLQLRSMLKPSALRSPPAQTAEPLHG